jgi:hypothetical protein
MILVESQRPEAVSPAEQESSDKLQIQEVVGRVLAIIRPLIEQAKDNFFRLADERGITARNLDCKSDLLDQLRDSEVQSDGTKSLLSAEIGGLQLLERSANKLEKIITGDIDTGAVDYHCLIKILRGVDKFAAKLGQEYPGDARQDLQAIIDIARKYSQK